MKLIIVRHAETDANAEKICQGHTDFKLSSKGKEQAKKVAERLKDIHLDHIYSSDLSRASDTCKEILSFHPELKMDKRKELRERCFGKVEGTKGEDIVRLFEQYYKDIGFDNWIPEGGENIEGLWKRVIPFFDELIKKHKDDTVLVVSHGGPISCILAYIEGKSIDSIKEYLPIDNTAVSVIDIDKGKVNIECMNCVNHLI